VRRVPISVLVSLLVGAAVACGGPADSDSSGTPPNAGSGPTTPAPTPAQTPTTSKPTLTPTSPSPPTVPPSSTPPSTAPPAPVRYAFPVSPASSASYGQVHHDYPASDIFAACGNDVLAVTSGVVEEVSRVDEWDPATDDPAIRGGLSVTIVGDDGVRYYASHLLDILPALEPGSRVATGAVIAHVGDTGNAAGTGCHVHFGLSPACGPGDWAVRRGTIYPWPYLDSWRDDGATSPAAEISEWLASHADQCANPVG